MGIPLLQVFHISMRLYSCYTRDRKETAKIRLKVVSAGLTETCGWFSRTFILHNRRRWYLKSLQTCILALPISP